MSSPLHRSWLGRLVFKLATAIGAGAAIISGPATAQSVTPEAAPAEWLRYAEIATRTITGWLEAESEAGVRLRAYLDATRPSPDQPTAPLLLRIWIDGEGRVSRIEHTPFAHAEANADMRGLIAGRSLPATPPRDMLLPLRILIQLPPVPAEAGNAALDENHRQGQGIGYAKRTAISSPINHTIPNSTLH